MKLKYIIIALVLIASPYFYTGPASAQCYEFYGLSVRGGENGAGAIYRTDENGQTSLVSTFPRFDGYSPYGDLCKATNGKLYGMTSNGGRYENGVMFEWDPVTGEYSKKIDFEEEVNGSYPHGSLIQAINGKLYGMTSSGGLYGQGVIFEWDPATGIYTKKVDFESVTKGGHPYGSLIQAENGLIYGMTSAGGANDYGVLFEWDPATNNFTKKVDFSEIENGSETRGTLYQAVNGKLYGMTRSGGLYGLGVLFDWDPLTNHFCKRLDFNGTDNGSNPDGSLMQADNGKLYGMTNNGGLYDYGVLFEWDSENDSFSKKLDFNREENGSHPGGSLTLSEYGNLIGLCSSGGVHGNGVLFEWNPDTQDFTKKCDLRDIKEPYGSIIQADNGKYYGMSLYGGIFTRFPPYNYGVVFEWDPDMDSCSVKFKFMEAVNGSHPVNLVKANNGIFYGITESGGLNDLGVIFELDPVTETFTNKFDFTQENGVFPGPLMKAKNGKFYGVTNGGPDYADLWTLFEWDPATSNFTLHFSFDEFDQIQSGKFPLKSLIQADNNNIYGTTLQGGENRKGVLFEWDPSASTFVKKIDFDSASLHLLVKSKNGKLYGYTNSGGTFNKGSLVEWDPLTNIFEKRLDFNDSVMISSLIQLENNKFYGATNYGNTGLFYEWDPEMNAYSIKLKVNNLDLDHTLGYDLIPGDNGKLYGTIALIDEADYYIFEWDPLNNNFQKKFDLDPGENILLKGPVVGKQLSNTINVIACGFYTSPSGRYNWTESGEYNDTISSISGCDSIITLNLTITHADNSVTQNQDGLTANATGATYQWIDCDDGNKPIDGEINQSFSPNMDGNYAVIISQDGCTDTSSCFSFIRTGLIMNTFKNNITLYPNPTTGSFFIDMGSIYPHAEITIMQLDGRVILKDKIINGRFKNLQISESPGTYMVIITTENESALFKILMK